MSTARPGSREVSERLGIPIDTHVISAEEPLVDETGEWATLYGIGPEGAVLVRPNGHVAWRTQASASEENLESCAPVWIAAWRQSIPDSRREGRSEKILYRAARGVDLLRPANGSLLWPSCWTGN